MSNPEDQTEESAIEKEAENADGVSDSAESVIDELSAEEAPEQNADGDQAEDEGSVEITIESVQAQLEEALEEVSKFKDIALRAEAEMQNVRRRASKDLENAHKFGIEKFVQNILPVVDSLEKAVESAEQAADDDANKAIVEGVGLCHKMLVDSLAKDGVVAIDPMGEPFDPNRHQALSMVENPDVEPNSVIAVIQKGYTLKDRLVRPAMVMVSKGSSPKIDEKA